MKIINETTKALPTALPPQGLKVHGVLTGNDDIHRYQKKWQDFYLIIEDITGSDVPFALAEIEIFGYVTVSQGPSLIYKGETSSDRGKIMIPISDLPAVDYIYIRQASDTNVVGATGADNPACGYQVVYNTKWSNG